MRTHTRRAVIKTGVRAGIAGITWATIGGALGKAYDIIGEAMGLVTDTARQGVEITGKKLHEVDRQIKESETPVVRDYVRPVKRVEDFRARGLRKLFCIKEEGVEENRESLGIPHSEEYHPKVEEQQSGKEVSRRGFFRSILSLVHNHPICAGIISGGSYWVGKSVLGAGPNLTIARLRDQIDELDNSRGSKTLEQNVGGQLTPEQVKRRINYGEEIYFLVGGMGLLVVIFFSLMNLTGNSILELDKIPFSILNILIFIGSLILIYFGARFK